MNIYIPKKLNFIVVKNENNFIVVIYNKALYFTFKAKSVRYLKLSKILLINSLFFKGFFLKGSYINNFIASWDIFFTKKLKFKGKGYKILTKKRLLIFSFNHSHITWFLFFNIICRKLTKQKYIFIYKNNVKLNKILINIKNIKPINIYTKRGIRLSKQKIFKKIGKRTN